jgi:VWFA-related protein
MKLLKLLFCLAALALAAGAQGQRTLCLFFDLNSMSAPDQLRAQENAIKFVQEQMAPSDRVTVMTFGSEVKVVQDFSSDREALIATLRGIPPSAASAAAAGDVDARLQAIQSVSTMLAAVPGKKALIFFSDGISKSGIDNQDQLKATVNAAVRANVAIYTVDARTAGIIDLPQR